VRKELRATRTELQKDIADIRRDLDRLAARSTPLPALRGEGDETRFDGESGQEEGA
jgi:hypothetical protein